jgi:hypothetical protein
MVKSEKIIIIIIEEPINIYHSFFHLSFTDTKYSNKLMLKFVK